MRILVIGCGFVGERVARRLVERGDTVFATTRKPERAESLSALGIHPIRFDVLDPNGPESYLLPTVDAVLLAVGYDRSSGVSMERVYVDGLAATLDLLITNAARIVYASSTSVYGGGADEWTTEATPTEPNTESGRIVLRAEDMVRDWAKRTHRRESILRFSGLYGPDRIINKAGLLEGKPLKVDPNGMLNLVHGDDAASASIAALTLPDVPPVVNVTDDRPIPRREYYRTAARLLGAPEPCFDPSAERNEGRRTANTLMKRCLLPSLAYPDIETGLAASIEAERAARREPGSR